MKKKLSAPWNFARFLRLGLGFAIIVQSVIVKDWALGIAGLGFFAMAVFNIGCCSTTNCYTSKEKTTTPEKAIIYEEVV